MNPLARIGIEKSPLASALAAIAAVGGTPPEIPKRKRKTRGEHTHDREKARRVRQAGFAHSLEQSRALEQRRAAWEARQ